MSKLIILDYSTGTVDIYDIDREQEDITEEYIKRKCLDLGFGPKDCEWMVADDVCLTFHNEILK